MEASEEEFGPIDVVVIGFPSGAPMTGDAVPILLDLVDRRIIRVSTPSSSARAPTGRSRASTPPVSTRTR